jgi:hypothetical protein
MADASELDINQDVVGTDLALAKYKWRQWRIRRWGGVGGDIHWFPHKI